MRARAGLWMVRARAGLGLEAYLMDEACDRALDGEAGLGLKFT